MRLVLVLSLIFVCGVVRGQDIGDVPLSNNDTASEATKFTDGSSSNAPLTKLTDAPVPTTKPTDAPVPTTKPTDAPVPTTKPTDAPVPTTKPTTAAPVPTTKPTTAAPVPTTKPTTATPKPAPTTTTEDSNTTIAPNTTEAPKTTEPPRTTVSPTPVPTPEVGKWLVKEGNVTCIIAKMAVQIVSTLSGKVVTHNLSPNSTSEGSHCQLPQDNNTQDLVLEDEGYSLNLTFAKNSQQTFLRNVSVHFLGEERHVSGSYYTVPNGKSYLCDAGNKLSLENVTIQFTHMQLQAFGTTNSSDFYAAHECETDTQMNDTIPIIVACILSGTVVCILIGYLVMRRRSRQRGYESV